MGIHLKWGKLLHHFLRPHFGFWTAIVAKIDDTFPLNPTLKWPRNSLPRAQMYWWWSRWTPNQKIAPRSDPFSILLGSTLTWNSRPCDSKVVKYCLNSNFTMGISIHSHACKEKILGDYPSDVSNEKQRKRVINFDEMDEMAFGYKGFDEYIGHFGGGEVRTHPSSLGWYNPRMSTIRILSRT